MEMRDILKFGLALSKKLRQAFIEAQNKVIFSRPNSILEIVTHWRQVHSPKMLDDCLSMYYTQISSVKSDFDFEIEKDIERTFPSDKAFSVGKPAYQKLFRILRAVAYHLPQVGYVQGFNFVAGSLL